MSYETLLTSGIALYPNTTLGVAGVQVGSFFLVASSNVDGALDVFQNIAGVATFVQVLPKQNVLTTSSGQLFYQDALGFQVLLVDLSTGTPKLPIVDSRITTLETNTTTAALSNTILTTPDLLSLQDSQGFVFRAFTVDSTGKVIVPAVDSRISNLESQTSILNQEVAALSGGGSGVAPLAAPLALGPVSASFEYQANQDIDTGVDTAQGYIPFIVPSDAYDLQVIWGNVSGIPETPGPPVTIACTVEYPIGSYHQMFFNGASSGFMDSGAILRSDVKGLDIPAGGMAFLHYRMVRQAGSTASMIEGHAFGVTTGSTMFPLSFTNRNTTPNWDACELIKTRTITDLVLTAGSNAATSASGNFSLSEVNQTISIPGAGIAGVTLVTTYTRTSLTAITLAVAPTTSNAAATASLSATNKLTGGALYTSLFVGNGPSPLVIMGRFSKRVKRFMLLGDSITFGSGSDLTKGSWAIEGLNFPNVAFATKTLTANPYIQSSMPSELPANLVLNHDVRLAHAAQCDYVLGMLGTNGMGATTQGDLVNLWKLLAKRGTKALYSTVIPFASSTDAFATLANQTPNASEPFRVALNLWMMNGAPIDKVSLLPVATTVATTAAIRCTAFNKVGAVVNVASGGTHPLFAAFDMASIVDTDNSGRWRVDLGTPTIDGRHPTPVIHAVMGSVVNAVLPSLL